MDAWIPGLVGFPLHHTIFSNYVLGTERPSDVGLIESKEEKIPKLAFPQMSSLKYQSGMARHFTSAHARMHTHENKTKLSWATRFVQMLHSSLKWSVLTKTFRSPAIIKPA